MSIVPQTVKTYFSKRIEELRIQKEATAINKATATLIENQRSEAVMRGFRLVQDEPESVMGTGKGPTPTDFLVASVAFCENVVFARNAVLNGLDVLSLETSVAGDWDMKGLFEIDGARSGFRNMLVETRLRTTGPVEKAVLVARQTHRRCPVHVTLEKAVKMSFKLFVNDVEVPL